MKHGWALRLGFAGFAAAVACVFAAVGSAQSGGSGSVENVWENGHVAHVLLTVGTASAQAETSRLYVVAPASLDTPQTIGEDGWASHDQVFAIRTGNGDAFAGACQFFSVQPGPKALPGINVYTRQVGTPHGTVETLVYATHDAGGTTMLTSDAQIQAAAAAGLVSLVDESYALTCVVGPTGPVDCVPDPSHLFTWPGAQVVGITIDHCGGGYVRSFPYLLDCPSACIRSITPGSSLTLTAIASPGFQFTGWDGTACAGQPYVCTTILPQTPGSTSVRARFARTGT